MSPVNEGETPVPPLVQRVPWGLFAALLLGGLLWFPGTAQGSIVNGDDALYAGVIRRLSQGADYFQVAGWRPPLFYGLGVVSTKALGVSEFALRLPSLLSALLLVVAVYLAGRTLFPKRPSVASVAALLIPVMGQVFLFARNVRGLDLLLAALLTFALGTAASSLQKKWWLTGLFLGLAFLTKSVVVVVVSPALLILWLRTPAPWSERLFELSKAAMSALVVGGLWPLWMLIAGAKNAATDHVQQHLVRRSVDATMVAAPESGPGYYLTTLLGLEGALGALALIALLVVLVLTLAQGGNAKKGGHASGSEHALSAWVLLAWVVGVLLPFSLVATRLPHYMLPAYPALALAVGAALTELEVAIKRRGVAVALGALVALGAFVGSPLGLPEAWGDADFSPHLRAGAQRARALLGAQGTLAVWNEYHAAAGFYFDGPCLLWTDNDGFYRAYENTHGFVEDIHYRRVAASQVALTLNQTAPACLIVRDDRAAGVLDALSREPVGNPLRIEALEGATLLCTSAGEPSPSAAP